MLKPHEDAYGNNIYDMYIHGYGGYDIVECEDGQFTLNGDSDSYTIPFEQWEGIQKAAARLVNGRVLDIGCGGGKHAIHFQQKGLEVIGIDNSPLAIEVCELRGLQHAWVKGIEDISPSWGLFDTILLLGNNWGLLANREKAKRILRNLYQCTTPDAKILAETLDPYGIAFESEEDRDYQSWNRLRGRMTGQLKVRIRYRKFVTPWHDYLFVSKAEMMDILTDTGWHIEEILDNEAVEQYIAVLVKDNLTQVVEN